jgi:hypothetical protein
MFSDPLYRSAQRDGASIIMPLTASPALDLGVLPLMLKKTQLTVLVNMIKVELSSALQCGERSSGSSAPQPFTSLQKNLRTASSSYILFFRYGS